MTPAYPNGALRSVRGSRINGTKYGAKANRQVKTTPVAAGLGPAGRDFQHVTRLGPSSDGSFVVFSIGGKSSHRVLSRAFFRLARLISTPQSPTRSP